MNTIILWVNQDNSTSYKDIEFDHIKDSLTKCPSVGAFRFCAVPRAKVKTPPPFVLFDEVLWGIVFCSTANGVFLWCSIVMYTGMAEVWVCVCLCFLSLTPFTLCHHIGQVCQSISLSQSILLCFIFRHNIEDCLLLFDSIHFFISFDANFP